MQNTEHLSNPVISSDLDAKDIADIVDNVETDNVSINTAKNQSLPANTVICLMAPTASGKTALAYELYDMGRFEIISVDSALIYRDMTIGTAKPSVDELERYPHHMVDIIDPTDTYSVASFISDVERLIADIHMRGKIPLLVGGTMMYYMAMFEGLSPVPETDFAIRDEVEQWREQVGIEALHDYLKQVDPIIAERLNATDTQRITRAVEVYKQTGKPLSEWQQLPKQALADNPNQYWLGLAVMPDRAWLHKRIEQRLEMMWQAGFMAEVVALLSKYALDSDSHTMRFVGYRQAVDYLLEQKVLLSANQNLSDSVESNHSVIDLNHPAISTERLANIAKPLSKETDEAVRDMKNKALFATRQLAKRQYTWLRNLVARYPNVSIGTKTEGQTNTDHESRKTIYQFDTIAQAGAYIRSQLSS